MRKKLFIILLSSLFLISFVFGAWEEFDKDYNQEYFEKCWYNIDGSCQTYLGKFNGKVRAPSVNIDNAGDTGRCKDSDGGWDIFRKGNILVQNIYSDGSPGSYYDVCEDKNLLREYFCSRTGSFRIDMNYVKYDCNLGCSGGACIPLQCEDSDGGFNLNKKGTITTVNSPSENGLQDYCSTEEPGVLVEYSCGEDRVSERKQACVRGCQDGACVSYELENLGDKPGADTPGRNESELCLGCFENDKCYPYGTRIGSSDRNLYCGLAGNFVDQKIPLDGQAIACLEDYECSTNLCIDGSCADLEAVMGEVTFLQEHWSEIACTVSFVLSFDESYELCMYDRFNKEV